MTERFPRRGPGNGTTTGTQSTTGYALRSANGADAHAVAALVNDAYGHYVERIGFAPRPMLEDYTQVIGDSQVGFSLVYMRKPPR